MSNVDTVAAAAYASPNKVRSEEYRCHAHEGKCGQRLASIWRTPRGRVLYVWTPTKEPTIEEREAFRAVGIRDHHEGAELTIRFVGPEDDGTTIVAVCPKHGPRPITIHVRA